MAMAVANIEAIQTVPPLKVTEERSTRCLSVSDTIGSEIYKGSMNIVMYYNKVGEEESGWAVAGWIKESLGRALSDEPMLSGRLIRGGEGRNNSRELRIVSNDSGTRLVEAKVSMTLEEFLASEDRARSEPELVFWKDIDEQNPEFSPLFYVQVSNFECGGYSIGISCSLLLADLVIMDDFIRRWGQIHKEIVTKNGRQKLPIFYLPSLKSNTLFPSHKIASSPSNNVDHQTVIFKVTTNENANVEKESARTLALHCIEEAEFKLGSKMATTYSLFVKESGNVVKVENCKRNEIIGKANFGIMKDHEISTLNWEDFGVNCVGFSESTNQPVCISCWIGSISENGLVMAVPSIKEDTSGAHIIVKIPN